MKKMLRKLSLILVSAVIPVVYAPVLQSSEFSIGFTESEYVTYYDVASSTNLDWDYSSDYSSGCYLYLSLGFMEHGTTEENILERNYPDSPPVQKNITPPTENDPQSGYTFLVKEDCFISGVARFTDAYGTNQQVRFWTDDVEECPFPMDPEGSGYWGPYDWTVPDTVWGEGPIDFIEYNYPLTKNNTYWVANVNSDYAHKIAQIAGNPFSSWPDGIEIVDYWYLKNSALSPVDGRDGEGGSELKGVADLHLRQFVSSGTLVTKAIDLGAVKVDIENFEVSFQTVNARNSFNKIEKTGSMAYNLRYATITLLGRTPVCAVDFEISESSDNVNYGQFKSNFSDIHLRHIKLKMNLTTEHKGITPLVDDVKITYNAYPEKILTASIKISPSQLTLKKELLVTSSTPTFAWDASPDFDGDNVTYNFKLATDPGFSKVVFSASPASQPSDTEVSVICSAALQDRTTYYYKIDIEDAKGAEVPFDSPLKFETELTKFLCLASGVSNDERVVTGQIQSGVNFTFSKELDFSTGSIGKAIEFLDGEGNPVPYSTGSLSGSEFSVVPSTPILPCRRYSIKISTALRDSLRGLFLSESVFINFLTLNDKSNPYTAELSGARMVLPAGSVSADYFAEVSQYEIAVDTQLSAANDVAIGSAFIIPVSTDVFLVDITDINGADVPSISGASLGLPFYEDSVDVEGVSVSLKDKLRIFILNENTGQWALVPGEQNIVPASGYSSPKKLSGGSVTANLVSGGKFALLAYPETTATNVQLRNIPNPFYMGGETEIVSGLFSIMEVENVEVQIYTLIGHLIYEKKYSSTELGDIKWDGKNKDGAYVGSGIYILKAKINSTTGSSEIKTRKIGFIRSWD